ncbi:cytochrome P450 [Cristinia sonorae]|uniref:Cytochrome P450 n=1 Tax=Cristinia sonorae TaxID=1940300 RepID=A0A8K0XST6_9AGAR|nr:cytochrome P450 [Cristinia sonorae]
MSPLPIAPLLAGIVVLYLVYKRITRISLDDIPGPKADSFWLGNVGKLYRSVVGTVDFKWQEEFGGIAHIKGPLGQDMLWICDPKALQFIYHTAGYNFPKAPERRALSVLTTDHGLVFVDGDDHKRQRKVMLPAFGTPESKALFPIFSRCAAKITTKWKDMLFDAPGQTSIFNVTNWLSFATMDAIGEAAFDHNFGSIDNQGGEMVRVYQTLLVSTFGKLSDGKVFFMNMSRFIPLPLLELFYAYMPGIGMDLVKQNRATSHAFAREMIRNKSEALTDGKGSHDIMSILVKANHSENEKTKLSEFEMISQMRTLLLAGHETTSTTLTWGLWELAKHPEIQTRLRKEIHAAEAVLQSKGRTQFTVNDLDSMPYVQACMKEIMRYHPPVFHTQRRAGKDIMVPLSTPITTKSGKVIQEVLVPKETRVVLSVAAYNRDKSIWGEDAHEFNPDRWLNKPDKRETSVGVYSNLLTFSGGVRGCIGWRFAIYEVQAFMIELISNFEFSMTDEAKKIRREACLVMAPVVNDVSEGAQMPLRVSVAQRE